MANQLKIDSYTHIVNKDILTQYNHTPSHSDYAIIMEFSPYFATSDIEDDAWKVCGHNNQLFLCPSIDLTKNIPEQLQVIGKKLRIRPECHVIGLVIYLSSFSIKADADKMLSIYNFAKEHSLSVVFHTGLPSVHFNADATNNDSYIPDICKIAKQYPAVNFIVAQMLFSVHFPLRPCSIQTFINKCYMVQVFARLMRQMKLQNTMRPLKPFSPMNK